MSSASEAADAFDGVFVAGSGRFEWSDGSSERLAVRHWAGDCDEADRRLFVDHCTGPTLDIGCGPGRLVGELTVRGISAMGIDVSDEAIRQTRGRGAAAVRLDVFDDVPGAGEWRHALLADGNIGIGGHPVRLLRRLRELLRPDGTVLAEVAKDGVGLVRDQRRLWVEGRYSSWFDWAVVGLDAVEQVADDAGLRVVDSLMVEDRQVVTLAR